MNLGYPRPRTKWIFRIRMMIKVIKIKVIKKMKLRLLMIFMMVTKDLKPPAQKQDPQMNKLLILSISWNSETMLKKLILESIMSIPRSNHMTQKSICWSNIFPRSRLLLPRNMEKPINWIYSFLFGWSISSKNLRKDTKESRPSYLHYHNKAQDSLRHDLWYKWTHQADSCLTWKTKFKDWRRILNRKMEWIW